MVTSTHRWPRLTVTDPDYGPLCECGNLKTDQALTCSDCAVERRRAPGYWERRTCECGRPKDRRAERCHDCANEVKRGVPSPTPAQPQDHPWRRAEKLRLERAA